MIVLSDGTVFLCTPRTGSRAARTALLEHYGGEESHSHHTGVNKVHKRLAERDDKPDEGFRLCTIIRDPYEQALSWYYLSGVTDEKTADGFKWFLETLIHDDLRRYGQRLNMYADLKPEFFLYDDDIAVPLQKMMGEPCPPVERVGVSNADKNFLDDEARRAIRNYFRRDIALFDSFRRHKT